MRAFDWFFRDRRTGNVVIGQRPNAPIVAFAACAVGERLAATDGSVAPVLRVAGTAALSYWALDELLRGVNPWRRCLGGATLAYVAWTVSRDLAGPR